MKPPEKPRKGYGELSGWGTGPYTCVPVSGLERHGIGRSSARTRTSPRAASSGCRLVPPHNVNLGSKAFPEFREMVSRTDGTLGRASREPLAESRAVRSPGNRQASGGHPKPRCTSWVPHAALPSRNSLLCLHSPAGLPGTRVAAQVTVSLQGPSSSPSSLSIRDRCRGRTGTCDNALFPLPSAQSACARVGGRGEDPRPCTPHAWT